MNISSSLLQKIALALIGLTLALPLLSAPPWFSPPSWGKTVLFRLLVVALALVALWLFARLPKEKRVLRIHTQSPLFLPLLFLCLFIGILLVATLFSLDPYFSFWGTPSRSWGLLNFLFAAAFGLLAFLLLKERQWRLTWAAALGAGALVALVAFAQQWGVKLTETFATFEARPVATLGSPLVLGAYLAVLAPLALGAALFAKRQKQLGSALLFAGILLALLAALFFTLSRGAWLGLAAASTFFVLLYPIAFSRLRFLSLVLLTAVLLIVGVAVLLPFSSSLQDQQSSSQVLYRFSFDTIREDPRMQVWPGLTQAVLDRPLLGYGAYNSSIAFDKYYTTDIISATGWWDSAHNIFLDIALWAGIPGLLAFLAFLGVLFWRLQQVKRKVPEYALFAHATQSALLAYVGALFFSFDVFPLILLFFLLVGFSFFLISRLPPKHREKQPRVFSMPDFAASPFSRGALAVLAVWFLYTFTLQPFLLNKELVLARHEAENQRCQQAIERIDPLANSDSFFTEYVRSQYVDIIGMCIAAASPETSAVLSQKAVQLLEKSVEERPFFTRYWILLGGYANNLTASSNDEDTKRALAQQAERAFQKALALSSQREETYREWIRTYKLVDDPAQALAKTQECLAINPKSGACWWEKAVVHVQLGDNPEAAAKALVAAKEKSYVTGEERLLSFIDLHDLLLQQDEKEEYYEEIAWAYGRLILAAPENFRYHTSLAFVYRELGQYDGAKKAALQAARLNPDITENVDAFLKTLPSEYQKDALQQLIYELILSEQYALAKEKALQCLEQFPENTHCEAWGVVAELWLGERSSLRLSASKPSFPERIAYHFYTPNFLDQVLEFYVEQENYKELVEVYTRLLRIEEKPQYVASLAFSFYKIGAWEGAAKNGFKLYQLQPTAKEEVRAFLQDVIAKQKVAEPGRLTQLLRYQPYQEIKNAFPEVFESL